ncbi:hypothetical protein MKZ26_21535 [Sporosarcina sp. FSL K6-6792]|uniref:hypothetical protein n=1 Tax=Sporosarcina sp. FSL K6-6792 TaxID=2921559 RepID=UPI0030F5FAB7
MSHAAVAAGRGALRLGSLKASPAMQQRTPFRLMPVASKTAPSAFHNCDKQPTKL